MIKKTALKTIAIATLCSASTLAAAYGETTTGTASKIILKDFIAAVKIEHSDVSDISITINKSELAETPISTENRDNVFEISGEEEPNQKAFWQAYKKYRGEKRLEQYLENRPSILIKAPCGTDIEMEGLIGKLDADNASGDLTVVNTLYVEADFDTVNNADVHLTGSSEIEIDTIAQNANLRLSGSGDLGVDKIKGSSLINLSGSGDILIDEVIGSLVTSLKGSGDVLIGSAASEAELSIKGSGDIQLEQATGALTLSIVGSGDIQIDEAQKVPLTASITGSGEIDFDGIAIDPSLKIVGSGEIEIEDYQGNLSYKGKQENLTIKNRR